MPVDGRLGAVAWRYLVIAALTRRANVHADALEELSRTDPLTGAANRSYLDDEMAREIARVERYGAPLALAFVDLDFFKQFNGTQGHAAGDALLQELVRGWRPELRQSDLVARIGGEEFVVVIPEPSTDEAAAGDGAYATAPTPRADLFSRYRHAQARRHGRALRGPGGLSSVCGQESRQG